MKKYNTLLFNKLENRSFGYHSDGFMICLDSDKIQVSDEYKNGDPHNFRKLLHNKFQQRRINCTLELLDSLVPSLDNPKILDLGCGEGHITAQILKKFPHAEVSGLDYSISAIQYAHQHFKNIDFVVGDACDLPYSDNYFDIVVCNNMWEHVGDPLIILEQIRKVVKPLGYLLISTPSRYRFKNLARVLMGKPVQLLSKFHVTEYTVGQIKEQLSFGKFKVTNVYSVPIKHPNKILDIIILPTLRTVLKTINSHHNLEDTVFYLAKKLE